MIRRFLLLCGVFLFILTGCSEKSDDVSMTIQEGSLTPTSATLIITDKGKRKQTFGEWFRIDKKVGEEYVKLDTVTDDIFFYMIGYEVDSNNQLEMETDWEWLYGSLPIGKYRLVKRLSDNTEFYVPFEIKE